MFGKLKSAFGSKDPSRRAAGPQLAMPLFADAAPIAPDAVVERWSQLLPDGPALRHTGGDGSVAQFEVGGRSLMVAHMPVPIPAEEALGAVRSSWMWQQPDEPVRTHKAHAIVTAVGSDDPLRSAIDVARLSTAVLAAGAPVALYWGNSRQMHAPRVVEAFAREDDPPPVPLFVGITISGESRSGPFSAATHGLEALGHKEFEVLSTRMGIGDIRATLMDLALYVLRSGPVLKHGQSFGPSADVKWSVRHAGSKLVEGRDVIVLGIP
jgi:hypothetical protein